MAIIATAAKKATIALWSHCECLVSEILPPAKTPPAYHAIIGNAVAGPQLRLRKDDFRVFSITNHFLAVIVVHQFAGLDFRVGAQANNTRRGFLLCCRASFFSRTHLGHS